MSGAPGTDIERALFALEKDLLREGGPQIAALRHYNFAIVPYLPADEYPMRRAVHELAERLRAREWTVGEISLHRLLLARLRAQGGDVLASFIRREKANSAKGHARWLAELERNVGNALGESGLAEDVSRELDATLDAEGPALDPQRTVIFLGRAGALYPFTRTSALLKHLAGRTRNLPVVLLYPGTVEGESGLSFMGVLPADRDYRPRIYR